jgi:hypothetical protein
MILINTVLDRRRFTTVLDRCRSSLSMMLMLVSSFVMFGVCISGIFGTLKYYYHIPQWDMVITFSSFFSTSHIRFLFEPENEHVHATAKLLYLFDIWYFDGTGTFLILAIIGCILLISSLIAWQSRHNLREHPYIYSALALLFVCAPMLWVQNFENLLWPKQIHVYLSIVFFLVSISTLDRDNMTPRRAGLIGILMMLSVLSFGYGLVGVLTLCLVAFVMRLPRRYIAWFSLVALLSVVIWGYLIGFSLPRAHSHPTETIFRVRGLAAYIFNFFLAPIGELVRQIFQLNIADVGAKGVTAAGFLIAIAASLSVVRRKGCSPAEAMGLALIWFALGNGLVTALTRLRFGTEQATAPRYLIIALLFWIGLVVFYFPQMKKLASRHAIVGPCLVLIGCLTLARAQVHSWPIMADYSRQVKSLEIAFINGVTDQSTFARNNPFPPLAIFVFSELRRRHLSTFSNPTTYWRGRLLDEVAPKRDTACIGSVDSVVAEGKDKPFVRLSGWAYIQSQKRPPTVIAIVDQANRITGLGYITGDRPDVHKILRDISGADIGWQAVVDVSPPLTGYSVYALTQTSRSVTACAFGEG